MDDFNSTDISDEEKKLEEKLSEKLAGLTEITEDIKDKTDNNISSNGDVPSKQEVKKELKDMEKEKKLEERKRNKENRKLDKEAKKGKKSSLATRKKKKKIIVIIVIAVIIILLGIAAYLYKTQQDKISAAASAQNTAIATRRDISSELTSSGTIAAKDTYSVTALVSGTIVSADFEEGDTVEKGQTLYQIDVSSMESELSNAKDTLTRAQSSYTDALNDYNDAVSDYSGNTYKSTRAGFISSLYIETGDKVSTSTELADIYNDQSMKIKIPFLSGEAALIGAGNEGVITLSDSQEQIPAVVTSVSNRDETLEGGRLVRYVTFQVSNPGGLTTTTTGTAVLGEFISVAEGTFEASTDTSMSAGELSASVNVANVLVHEGDYVNVGTPIFTLTSDSAEKLIRTYKNSLNSAEATVESAQEKLDTTQDSYEDYTITAPIAGKIITKTYKLGDKIGTSSGSTSATTLASIYDMSQYTFEMSIDELDIKSVELGQSVTVEADAFEGNTYSGIVTNISLESTASSGVSTYPVTVTLDSTQDLLPGMNVDAYIELASSSDAITIPADSLMRGNKVYIKDDTVKEAQGAVPAGFKSVDVTVGLTSDDYVEILTGVDEGDTVYQAKSTSKTTTAEDLFGGSDDKKNDQGGGPPRD